MFKFEFDNGEIEYNNVGCLEVVLRGCIVIFDGLGFFECGFMYFIVFIVFIKDVI